MGVALSSFQASLLLHCERIKDVLRQKTGYIFVYFEKWKNEICEMDFLCLHSRDG